MLLIRSCRSRAPFGIAPVKASGRASRGLEALGFWMTFTLVLFLQPLYAEAKLDSGAVAPQAESSGSFHFVTEQGREPATVLTSDYQVTVSGLLADTRLTQTFENTGLAWREGVYVFPLPQDAIVYGFTMTAGERVVKGEVREREQARKIYQLARESGRQAARVDQQRPNLFTTHLANIPPGESVTVELHYQQSVRYDGGGFELQLPTTLTPRFMPGVPVRGSAPSWEGGWAAPTNDVADAHRISPVTVAAQELDYRSHWATVSVAIHAGLPVASVASASHALNTVWDGEEIQVTPRNGRVRMDRDLLIRWTPVRGEAPSAAVFHEHWQGQDYLLTLLVPGHSPESARGQAQQRMPRELIFVIDTSGSMTGQPIAQARESLLRGLDTLQPDDRFNIIQFNSQSYALFARAMPADRFNLDQARRYVQGLSAGGGTVMSSALDLALGSSGRGEGRANTGHLRQVVFITDGAVGNERSLFAQIQRQLGDSRLFTVGIGSAPNVHFMREAARFGRGTSTIIHNLAEVSAPLDQLFRKMQSPVLADIQTRWPADEPGAEALPVRPGDLFAEEPFIQITRGISPQGQLKVSGRQPGGARWRQSLDLANAAPAVGLHRLWAREKIDSLADAGLTGRSDNDTREAITELALSHQLLTRYTSFIAVDQTPRRKASEHLDTDHLATLMPAGSGQRIAYPQTATAGPLLIMLGVAGLLMAMVLALSGKLLVTLRHREEVV